MSEGAKLLPDFFLDTEDPEALRDQMEKQGAKPAFGGGNKTATASSGPEKTFQIIQSLLNEELVKSINGIFQFNLSGMFVEIAISMIQSYSVFESLKFNIVNKEANFFIFSKNWLPC